MEIRNTTDFDGRQIRAWIARVVREVRDGFLAHDPRSRPPEEIRARATKILSHCDVWVRQQRPDRAPARRRKQLQARAALASEMGHDPILHVTAASAPEESRHSSGHAYLSGRAMRLTIPDGDLVGFVWLVRHEVWHLFGLRHPDFPDSVMHATPSALDAVRALYDIPEGANLPVPAKKPASTLEDRAGAKLKALAAREARWLTKLRRAQNALAKIKKSKSYYERQLATAAKANGFGQL